MVSGHWKRILTNAALQRSSHTVSVIEEKAYIFGGELVPREPRDNDLFQVNLNADDNDPPAKVISLSSKSAPSPRVGSASATLGRKWYLFSGRGGLAMNPIEEYGALHEYDAGSATWSQIDPSDAAAPFPPARSYHCMTSDSDSTLYLHAGCPESGRLADLWSFDVKVKHWTKLAEGPAPQRGGTSIAYVDGKLYRMNGFDGKQEQGGSLDIFDVRSGTWSTERFEANGVDGPEARSVSALLPLNINSKAKLLTLFGERDPSSLGHAGAGKMLSDWWVYDVLSKEWERGDNSNQQAPPSRGWFGADVIDERRIMVASGLSESNERLDDLWILSM